MLFLCFLHFSPKFMIFMIFMPAGSPVIGIVMVSKRDIENVTYTAEVVTSMHCKGFPET